MPLARLVLIIVAVIAAAGVTVAIGALAFATLQIPAVGLLVAVPVGLIAYVAVRVISDRMSSSDDRHYDGIER